MALFFQENQNTHYYMDKAKPFVSQVKKSILKHCTLEIRCDTGRAVWRKWMPLRPHPQTTRFVEARVGERCFSAEPPGAPTTIMHLRVSSVSTSTHTQYRQLNPSLSTWLLPRPPPPSSPLPSMEANASAAARLLPLRRLSSSPALYSATCQTRCKSASPRSSPPWQRCGWAQQPSGCMPCILRRLRAHCGCGVNRSTRVRLSLPTT